MISISFFVPSIQKRIQDLDSIRSNNMISLYVCIRNNLLHMYTQYERKTLGLVELTEPVLDRPLPPFPPPQPKKEKKKGLFCNYVVDYVSCRFLEWICCCCGGAEQNMHSCEQEILFPDSSTSPCRDVMFQHPRTTACDLLAQLPSSLALDSGYNFGLFLPPISQKISNKEQTGAVSSSYAQDPGKGRITLYLLYTALLCICACWFPNS